MLPDLFYRQTESFRMRSPVRSNTREAQSAIHACRSGSPVRRSAQRVVERHYDETGRLRHERVGEYLAQEWTVLESADRDNEAAAAGVDGEGTGCLSGIASAVICTAFLIGFALIGGAVGAFVAGNGGGAIGRIAAPRLGLWWLQSGPPARS